MELLKVKNFASVTTGGTPSTKNKDFWKGGDIPWLNSGELNQNIVKTTRNYITELGLKNSSAKLMPENTVLIALTGATTGVVGFLTFEASANQSVTGILPSNKHFPKYLFYYLKSIRPKVLHDAYGGAQPHISQGYVKELKIPLPPLDQQKKIAAILDAADAYRQKTKALIKKYDELKQSLFLDMFGDSSIFEHKLISEVASDKKYSLSSGPFGSNLTSKHYTESGIIILRGTNVTSGTLDLSNVKYVSEEKATELKRSELKPGDVVVVAVGSSGKALRIPDNLNRAIMSQNFNKISPNKKIVTSLYLEFCFNSQLVQNQFKREMTDTVRTFLSLTKIKGVSIPVPPLELQNQFAERVQAIEAQKAQAQASLAQAEDLFNSLLQRAFKGELAVE